jgi:hypothetical protein
MGWFAPAEYSTAYNNPIFHENPIRILKRG